MRYRDLMEAKLDPHQFGTISHGPDQYLHYCHNDADVLSIARNGFDMKRWGHTAKKFNVAATYKNDLYGVFATAYDAQYYVDRPFVVFEVVPRPHVLASGTDAHGAADNLMSKLAGAYGFSGKKLTKLLLAHDIQVVHSIFEFIILTPERIRITDTSIRLKAERRPQ